MFRALLGVFLWATVLNAGAPIVPNELSAYAQRVLSEQKILDNLKKYKSTSDLGHTEYYTADIDSRRERRFAVESSISGRPVYFVIENRGLQTKNKLLTYAGDSQLKIADGNFVRSQLPDGVLYMRHENFAYLRQDTSCSIIKLKTTGGTFYSIHYWQAGKPKWDLFMFAWFEMKHDDAEKFEATLKTVYSDIPSP